MLPLANILLNVQYCKFNVPDEPPSPIYRFAPAYILTNVQNCNVEVPEDTYPIRMSDSECKFTKLQLPIKLDALFEPIYIGAPIVNILQ
jgi:hypothetical protein